MNASNAERIASALAAVFPGPSGRYLRQKADGSEGWAFAQFSPAVLRGHVEGRQRIGRGFDPERLSWCAFDLDGKRHPEGRAWALASAQRIARALADLGITSLLEQSRSGTGFHGWTLFDANGPTLDAARELAAALLRSIGLPDSFSEKEGVPGFYPWPKADGECGRVPYLPLHGACNGKPSGLLCELATGEPFADQLAALEAAERTPRDVFDAALATLRLVAPKPPAPVKPARPRCEPRPFNGELKRPAEIALTREVERVASAPDGVKHPILYSASRNLGELVEGGELPEGLVVSNLLDAAANFPPERGREVERTIANGIAKGKTKPRNFDAPIPKRRSAAAPAPTTAEEPPWLREESDGPESEPEPEEKTQAVEASATAADCEADPVPELPEVCWRGGFSAFRDAFARCSEAANAYLFGAYLVLAGLALGRQARLGVGFNVFPNVYVALVGESGRSRKSTAQGFGRSMLREVDEGVEHSLGVGSPEGLVKLFADDAHRSKRVLLDCGELASLLRKGAAEATRGLLPLIVDLYDCPPAVRLPNAKADVEGREPYLCIMAGSTVEWIAASLSVEDARAGFAGRFMFFTGRPKAPIPWPPPPDLDARTNALGILRDARDRHATPRTYPLAADARGLWEKWYRAERERSYPSETLEVVAQRLPLFAWKLGLAYAALEGTAEVTREHLAAGIAFADYQRETQAAVLGGLGDSEQFKTEQRIRAALKKHGPLSGWRLQQVVRHVPAENLARALSNLARIGAVEERKAGRGTVWALVTG